MKISVALCTYNGQDYIEEQLLSIFNQTLAVDEIVVCDDGSTDATIEIIERFAKAYPINLRLQVNVQNLGFIENFEQALSLCNGDILFLSDQDDVWFEDKVSIIVGYFEDNLNKDVVFTDAFIKRSDRNTSENLWDIVGFNQKTVERCLQDYNGLVKQFVIEHNVATGATMALRKRFLDHALPLFPNKTYYHDYLFAMRSSVYGTLGLINRPLMYYRLHDRQTAGLDESGDGSSIMTNLKKFWSNTWTSNLQDITLKKEILNDLLGKSKNLIPRENMILLNNVVNHLNKRIQVIEGKSIKSFFIAMKMFLKSNYKFSSYNYKVYLKYFIKDLMS